MQVEMQAGSCPAASRWTQKWHLRALPTGSALPTRAQALPYSCDGFDSYGCAAGVPSEWKVPSSSVRAS